MIRYILQILLSAIAFTGCTETIVGFDSDGELHDMLESKMTETNKIYYISSNGKNVVPTNASAFGAKIVSNKYKDGNGIITFDAPLTTINYGAFDGCTSLMHMTIPNGVTKIRERAFCNCTLLTSITIPNSVTRIGHYAFANCRRLKSIKIPDSITSIEEHAFSNCTSLTSVIIPNSVTKIQKLAFAGCISLTSVYCKPTTPPTGGPSMFFSNAPGRKIYVPTASVEAYKSAQYWSDYADCIYSYTQVPYAESCDKSVSACH